MFELTKLNLFQLHYTSTHRTVPCVCPPCPTRRPVDHTTLDVLPYYKWWNTAEEAQVRAERTRAQIIESLGNTSPF